ncbi:MAG TPA: efflux RND transporter permease subunit [Gammaproteobacteria bacterium]|nr:efflux RND transporter permease subunit [Gammaproteobacteria bacterium]
MKGMIAWFARNDVAANLLMVTLLALGGWALMAKIPLEVFPAFELRTVVVQVPFPGATPAEVEEGITVKIEEAVQDLEGIKQLRSTAVENSGTVIVEVDSGHDPRALMNDIKARVDAISTFPADSERPVVYVPEIRRDVITVIVSGELPEHELRLVAERVRDELVDLEDITQVELDGVRPYEISIEVSEQTLRQYGLTLEEVASAVRRTSLDLAAGSVHTTGGEVLIRTEGQARAGTEFEDIVVRGEAGARLTIRDIGVVRDGFSEEPLEFMYNGRPAAFIDVFRVGEQSALDVARAVRDYVDARPGWLPPGVELDYWRDQSRIVQARLNTLLKSALQGGILILILLTLFLRPAVALWVVVGIPVAFMGGIALMPVFGVTINLLSLFAFILVLGIVVDDAIVTGENIFTRLQKGEDPLQASIRGTQEIAVPVTFGILTTVVAFIPLLMIEGVRGQLFAQIPLIVIPVLLFSLVESKLILPAHLKHVRVRNGAGDGPLSRLQARVQRGLERGTQAAYQPMLQASLRNRYLAGTLFTAVAFILFSLAIGGHMRFIFFPRIQAETASATVTMPPGTPFEATAAAIGRIDAEARSLRERYRDPETGESVIKGILASVGSAGGGSAPRTDLGRVLFEIVPPEERTVAVTSADLVGEWRQGIGPIPGAKEVSFRAEIGHAGAPLDVQMTGQDFVVLRALAGQVRERLASYPGVFDITDSFEDGKQEIKLRIRPEAELLGITLENLARQVRHAFFGFEAQRIQRGREEVRVYVRYPEAERRSLHNLDTMRIRTPAGAEVPFAEVASAEFGRGFAQIRRVDRNRTINITADANKEVADIEAIKRDLAEFLAEAVPAHAGVGFTLEGEAREQRESFGSLGYGLMFVLFMIYALLAIPFRSYLQPLIVMSVIPFGAAGAMLGHIIMGMNLTIMSLMGMLALTGVVVNDSLVLVDYINRRRADGMPLQEAVRTAGIARLRPVLLTSLTTFAGLTPLIFEKSTQAQFLIPMAVSLGFGILFATFITLLLVPLNYLVLEDLRHLAGRIRGRASGGPVVSATTGVDT